MLHFTGQLTGKPVKHGNLLVNRWSGKNLQFSALDTTWKSSMDLQHWGKLAKHMHRVHHSTCFYVNVSTLEWLDQSQWYFTWRKYGPATAHSTKVKKLKQSSQKACYHGNFYHYYAYNLRRKLKSYHGSLLRYGKPDLQFLGTLKNNYVSREGEGVPEFWHSKRGCIILQYGHV